MPVHEVRINAASRKQFKARVKRRFMRVPPLKAGSLEG
jgi:hypothetical protein